MNLSTGSREQILRRIRTATSAGDVESPLLSQRYASIPRRYIRKGSLSEEDKIALLIERLREYDAEVSECLPEGLVEKIYDCLTASGRRIFIAPSGLPAQWLLPDFQWRIDRGMSHDGLEAVEGAVTTAYCAVADSGTIVLHHTESEGRRALTLLPDWHLCIVYARQVVETLPEYFAHVQQSPSLVTWISGPSATADIEMTRIKGVHGPRYLNVILVRD